MTKKEAYRELRGYLSSLSNSNIYKKRVSLLEEELISLKCTNYEEHIRGSNNNRVEMIIDEIWELKENIAKALLLAEEKRTLIEDKIHKLQFPYEEVLRRRYIAGESLEEIAVDMGELYKRYYSYGYVRNIVFVGVEKYAKLESY